MAEPGSEVPNQSADIAKGGSGGLPDVSLERLEQLQNSDVFKNYLAKMEVAQDRAKRAVGTQGVGPSFQNRVPGTGLRKGGSALAGRAGDFNSAMHNVASSLARGVGGAGGNVENLTNGSLQFGSFGPSLGAAPSRPARPKRAPKDRSVNRKFRFREKQAPRPLGEDGEPLPRPADIGGFQSGRALLPGLPVRLADDTDGAEAWRGYFGIAPADVRLSDLRGRPARVLEVNGNSVSLSFLDGPTLKLPAQALTLCDPAETLQSIAWRFNDIPEPSDFPESIAALDAELDPGADPNLPSEAICVPGRPADNAPKVRRFRASPAVGWQGVHNRVTRQVLRSGRMQSFPVDGLRARGRLLEAMEVVDGRVEGKLAEGLPREAEFTLGDGQLPDCLECAVARMVPGEIAAICCTDADLFQAGGEFEFRAMAPRPPGGGSAERRALFMFELLGADGGDPLHDKDEERRVGHALARKDAGTLAFKAGRVRLARERYRRAANFLSVGLSVEGGALGSFGAPGAREAPGSYSGEARPRAEELRRTCWLNAAQCELSLKNHAAARRYADAVLSEDPSSAKALFRRASALMSSCSGQELQAIEDLRRVLLVDGSNAAARQLLQKAEQTQKRSDSANRGMFKKACSDLVGEFERVKARIDGARAAGDGAEAAAALEELAAATPRLTAAKAIALKLGKTLSELDANPPGESVAVRELAVRLLAEVRALIIAGDHR